MAFKNFPGGPTISSDRVEIAVGSSASYLHAVEPGKCRRTYNDFCHQPCAVCGLELPKWRAPGRVMVAHHRDPKSKKHSPSALSRRSNKWWEVLVAELVKCVPVCATCHAVIHDVMGDFYDHRGVSDARWAYILREAKDDVSRWSRP